MPATARRGCRAPHGQPRRAWASATAGPQSPRETAAPPTPQGALCLLKQSLCQGRCAHLGQVPWAQNGRTRGPRACQPRSLPLSSRGGRSVGAPGRSPGRPFPEDPRRRSGRRPGSGTDTSRRCTERRHGPAAPKRGRTPPAQLSEPPLLKGTIRTRPVGRAPCTGRDQNKPSNLE